MKKVQSIRNKALQDLIAYSAASLRCWQQEKTFCSGVTFSQFNILVAIDESEVLPLSVIPDKFGIDKSTVTRIIQPLVSKNLVSRQKSKADSRSVYLQLTKKGKEILAKILYFQNILFDRVESSIPKKERKQVFESVSLFMQAINKSCSY